MTKRPYARLSDAEALDLLRKNEAVERSLFAGVTDKSTARALLQLYLEEWLFLLDHLGPEPDDFDLVCWYLKYRVRRLNHSMAELAAAAEVSEVPTRASCATVPRKRITARKRIAPKR
jgi:hypothetical protein